MRRDVVTTVLVGEKQTIDPGKTCGTHTHTEFYFIALPTLAIGSNIRKVTFGHWTKTKESVTKGVFRSFPLKVSLLDVPETVERHN